MLAYDAQWFCPTRACVDRQLARAIVKLRARRRAGETPFLFVPLPLQVEMAIAPIKRLLVAGAAGSTKSHGARWAIAYAEARTRPGTQTLLLRCTYPELEKNHLKYMSAECDALGDAKYVGGNTPQVRFENGSLISMGYCKDLADIPGHMGAEWDRIIIEEGNSFLPQALTEIPTRDRGSFVVKREVGERRDGKTTILANPGGRGMLALIDHYITKNPDPAEYPAYNAAVHGFIHATLDDNPYLPEDYAETTLSGLSAARYQQLRYGNWLVVAGQFFEAFASDTHITHREAA